MKEWLTPADLEKEYAISQNNQKKLRMHRKIPFYKIGKYIRYKKSDIEAWFESHKIEAK